MTFLTGICRERRSPVDATTDSGSCGASGSTPSRRRTAVQWAVSAAAQAARHNMATEHVAGAFSLSVKMLSGSMLVLENCTPSSTVHSLKSMIAALDADLSVAKQKLLLFGVDGALPAESTLDALGIDGDSELLLYIENEPFAAERGITGFVDTRTNKTSKFVRPMGMCTDAVRACVYVVDHDGLVAALDSPLGAPQASARWVHAGLERPTDCALSADGARLFVVEFGDNCIAVLDAATGEYVSAHTAGAALAYPTAIAAPLEAACAWVTDSEHSRVVCLDTSSERIVAVLGTAKRGDQSDELDWPRGVCCDSVRDRVLIADQNNKRVQVYCASSAQCVASIRHAFFNDLCYVRTAGDSVFVCSDAPNARVLVFHAASLEFDCEFGLGTLGSIRGIAVDERARRVYVADPNSAVVHVFTLF